MSQLRNQMKKDLELKGYSPCTQKIYLRNVKGFADYYGKSPVHLGEEEIKEYIHN